MRSLMLLLLAISCFVVLGLGYAYAQTQGSGLESLTTLSVLVTLGVIALLLISLRFKWIELSVDRAPGAKLFSREKGVTVDKTSDVVLPKSALELSENVLGEYKSELSDAVRALTQERERLEEQKVRLTQSKEATISDTQQDLKLLRELERSKLETGRLAVEVVRLRERYQVALEEIDRLRQELNSEREELDQIRSRLTTERQELQGLRAELDKERSAIEKALQEIAMEWERIGARREELERTRNELAAQLALVSKARDELVEELEATIYVWSGKK